MNGSGTRSSLMYETLRIVEKLKPKYVIWENVKNILSKRHRHNFDNYLKRMDELGYENQYQVLNAKDFNIPQNRERVFVVSIRKFKFKNGNGLDLVLGDILEKKVDDKYYVDGILENILVEKGYPFKVRNATKLGYLEAENGDSVNLEYLGSNTRRARVGKKICNTLQARDNFGVVLDQRLRKLTPKECWRLMGFQDEEFEKAQKVNSNSQLYKQAGNSIVVNILMEIFKELL